MSAEPKRAVEQLRPRAAVPPSGPAMERDAKPGEMCSCGRPAVTVYFTERFGEVPWCGEYGDMEASGDGE